MLRSACPTRSLSRRRRRLLVETEGPSTIDFDDDGYCPFLVKMEGDPAQGMRDVNTQRHQKRAVLRRRRKRFPQNNLFVGQATTN